VLNRFHFIDFDNVFSKENLLNEAHE